MCASLEQDGKIKRPRGSVAVTGPNGKQELVWAGFARSEILSWWQRKKGATLLDIDATRFAERADDTRELIWDEMPPDSVIRGLCDQSGKTPVLKIVTRPADAEELAQFRHPRMPLLEKRIYS